METELEKTLTDLSRFHDHIGSVAIVPVGLTKFREGLYPLAPFDAKDCASVISQVNGFGDEFVSKYGRRILYCSDEFYLKAGIELPKADYYEGYPQLDNGVGSIRSMSDEFYDELDYLEADYGTEVQKRISIATGSAAYGFISEIASALCQRCKGEL